MKYNSCNFSTSLSIILLHLFLYNKHHGSFVSGVSFNPSLILSPNLWEKNRLGGRSREKQQQTNIVTLKFIYFFHIFGEGNGNPLQYSCLENPMDRGAWWATVHGVAKSLTRLSDFTFTFFSLSLSLFLFYPALSLVASVVSWISCIGRWVLYH